MHRAPHSRPARLSALLIAGTLLVTFTAHVNAASVAAGDPAGLRLACTTGDATTGDATTGDVTTAASTSGRVARSGATATAPAAPAKDGPASDLRIGLGRMLGEHAYLLMEAMRATASDRPDVDAIVGGIDENTEDLTAAIAGVYGPAAGTSFERLWRQHIDAAIDWADAQAAGNTSAAGAADASMANFRTRFNKFLARANPDLSGDAEAHALRLHLDQLTSFISMDYKQVFRTQRAAYSHMFEFGDSIAEAIATQFPDRYPGAKVAFSPRTTLRLDLGRLLGEHLVLAAEAMRAGLDARQGSDAAAASLKANGKDLAALIGQVYGPDAQSRFNRLWNRHINAYLDYINAIRTDDAGKRRAALDELHGYHTRLAAFIHKAVPSLRTRDLKALISHHVTALINQVDAAAAGDHDRSVAVTREAYAHMFVVGDALGTAIADQFPDKFAVLKVIPSTSTGSDATAVPVSAPQLPIAALLIGLWPVAFVIIMWGLRRRLG